MATDEGGLRDILTRHEKAVLDEWVKLQLTATNRRSDLIDEGTLREQSRQFLTALQQGLSRGAAEATHPAMAPVREVLSTIAQDRAQRGFAPDETATFVFSLKQPVFSRLQEAHAKDGATLVSEVWRSNLLLDALGLLAMEGYQKGREQLIARQQQELLELSTPVVRLWEGVLALPLIGTLDSARTQVVMENLLQTIVDTGATIAIIDITGVPTVDTLVAQHLIKTVSAARLMGADCIISGIRPQIAQTIVHLGVELHDITTKATLADAFAVALKRTGMTVVRASSVAGAAGAKPTAQS
jgi:rsbT co-antagonist protein RsbR